MGLMDKIKSDVKKSGQNKSKFAFIREGAKARFRFLTDMDDGMEVTFHDSFAASINVPCQELFGRDCPYCGDDELRTRSQYIWSVWDYDANEVKLFMFPVNNCSPVPALVAMYENYGTLTDRDFVITVSGKQQSKAYTVMPMDKVKFRNDKAKPFSEKAILKMLDKAFPCDATEDEEDDEEETPKTAKKGKASAAKTSSKKQPEPEDDDDYEEEEWGDDEKEEVDYSEMSPQELYKLCKERKIEVAPKKPAKYYIKQLEEFDAAQEDWGDGDDEEDGEWED